MNKVVPILLLAFWLQNGFAQVPLKEIQHSEVQTQNTFRINTKKLEFSPSFYQNGIVYVSANTENPTIDGNIGEPFFELFYAELDGKGMPSNAQPFSTKVNSSTHEGPVTFNFTEDLIFYTSNSDKTNTKGKKTMKIFQASKGNNDWENRQELPFNGEEFHTMHPSLDAAGTKLYFASNRPGGYGGTDIYYVENYGNGWSKPVNLGPTVNTNKNEAFPFIHESGMLFFASEGHKGMGGYDIYTANVQGKAITEIIHLGTPFNSEKADFGLILNPTGTQGFFTSARYGGIGQDDIYLFDAPNGVFTTPKSSTQQTLLTVVDEATGATIPDASIYIFEKNKNGLFGKDDLYEVVVEAKEDKPAEMEVRFSMKKDLGQPNFYTNSTGQINTTLTKYQEYLLLVTKKGFANQEMRYIANQEMDFVEIEIPMTAQNCITVSGVVSNDKTGATIPNANLSFKSSCNEKIYTVTSNANGQYERCLPYDCAYSLVIAKQGFFTKNRTFSTKQLTQAALTKDFQLNPIEGQLNTLADNLVEGSTIILENIYYDFDKSAIRTGAAEELDALVALMLEYPSMEVELIAHTDSRGEAAYNRSLSRERALAAKDYLVRKGIPATRITAKGMGEIAIRNHCTNGVKCSDREHEYNRRTEVRVTKLRENISIQYSGK